MGQIKNIKLHIVTDIKDSSYILISMASLTFTRLCTKAISSNISRVTTSHFRPSTRSLQLCQISYKTVEGGGEDSKDFDATRDQVLGDFSKYNISDGTVRLLNRHGIEHLFEVQYKTYNAVREGTDVFVQARTGTGKTLGFALPIIEAVQSVRPEPTKIFPRPPQVIALGPTRELAIQIAKEFDKFAARQTAVSCFYGGVSIQGQTRDLYKGIDILVGTPGRIKDHLNRGQLNLSTVKHVILDEADRMLDMGFQRDIEEIFSYAYTKDNKPQTLLFSATLPNWVRDITRKYTSDNMEQFDLITTAVKSAILVDHKRINCVKHQHQDIVKHLVEKQCGKDGKALVFTQTKREAENLSYLLRDAGIRANYITGDKSQDQREYTLNGFKGRRFNVLVATDVAARGLDIPHIDLVIQTSPPADVDAYIHRAGRTGRAGQNGLSIVLFNRSQAEEIRKVEKHAGIQFNPVEDDSDLDELTDGIGSDFPKGFDRQTRNFGRSSHGFRGYNRRPSGDFGGSDRRPSGDFGGFDRRPSRDFGGFERRPTRSFGGFDRRPSGDFRKSSNNSGQSLFGSPDEKPSRDFGFDRRPSRDLKPSKDFHGSKDLDDLD